MRSLRLHCDCVFPTQVGAFPGQRCLLTYFWSLPSEWRSLWHAENVQLKCDEWKCDLVQQGRIGKCDKSRNRTKWRNLEVTCSLIFLWFAGCPNSSSWPSGSFVFSPLFTALPTISCHDSTLMLEAWSFAAARVIFFQTAMVFVFVFFSACTTGHVGS